LGQNLEEQLKGVHVGFDISDVKIYVMFWPRRECLGKGWKGELQDKSPCARWGRKDP